MKTQYEVLMQDPEFRKVFAVEALSAEAAELIARLMKDQGLTKSDLARRLNKSRAWVTQLLSGSANMTVRTLAEVVNALEAEVTLEARTPQWKSAGKPKAIRSQAVVYRMGDYKLDTGIAAEGIFRLEGGEPCPERSETEGEDPVRPEYAA